ncbi:hypothetical protein LCGC14_1164700 [marine sediment metagenome]|uniref:Uncharacterized protein n=1 Tax=marine sediment metagenome TaxID=412755 RepID=A0A0F9P9V2_9ZZZZ
MKKCTECGKRKWKIDYAKSLMEWTHGFTKKICRQCYIEIIERELKKIKANLKEQKILLEKEIIMDNVKKIKPKIKISGSYKKQRKVGGKRTK